MKFFLALMASFLGLLCTSTPSFAQYEHLLANPPQQDNTYTDKFLQGFPYPAQKEPELPKVKFFKLGPPRTMQERVNRLTYGVYSTLPPEYDHYGYEMRRYMASVGHPDVLSSYEQIQGQLKNIKNAKIILKYWKRLLGQDMSEIEEAIETNPDLDSLRSRFKYNRGVVNAFFVECQDWLDHNQSFLEFMAKIDGNFSFKNDEIRFKYPEDAQGFLSFYTAREQARRHMVEYPPFAMMVY